ncbi:MULTISPECIES: hypothetical protein [unclassified Streptomyces]|uniref:hypothetical protein n=1 Tax=unclassified Streptomyces TaxID=2593676 RepID=UPI00365F6748
MSEDERNPQSQRWDWGPRPAEPPHPGLPPEPPHPGPPRPGLPPVTPAGADSPYPEPPSGLPLPPLPQYVAWAPEPPVVAPPPPRARGASTSRGPLLVGALAVVVAGAFVAGWYVLTGQGESGNAAGPGPAVSLTTTGEPSAAPTGAAPARSEAPSPVPSATSSTGAAPGPSAVPSTGAGTGTSADPSTGTAAAGHTVVRDGAGFSVAVPDGWERSHDETGSGSFYRPPGDRSALLQVFRVTEPASTGECELLRLSSRTLGANPGYRQVSLEPVAGSACELVYEYDSAESGGRRRGVERIVTAPGGGRWALLAAGPAADGETVRAHLTAALESFRPE